MFCRRTANDPDINGRQLSIPSAPRMRFQRAPPSDWLLKSPVSTQWDGCGLRRQGATCTRTRNTCSFSSSPLSYPKEVSFLGVLVTIRESQVMRSVVQLCQLPTVSERGWLAAAEVLAANLILHDHKDIGDRLLGLTYRQVNERRVMATNISQLVAERSTPSWASADREVRLLGLAGWQHREFFKVLLPLYAQTGIPGAVGLLERLKADELKSTARRRLAELYQDENFMALMPMEL